MLPFSKSHSRDRSNCFAVGQVLSDGYGQLLPVRYTCPEPRGCFHPKTVAQTWRWFAASKELIRQNLVEMKLEDCISLPCGAIAPKRKQRPIRGHGMRYEKFGTELPIVDLIWIWNMIDWFSLKVAKKTESEVEACCLFVVPRKQAADREEKSNAMHGPGEQPKITRPAFPTLLCPWACWSEMESNRMKTHSSEGVFGLPCLYHRFLSYYIPTFEEQQKLDGALEKMLVPWNRSQPCRARAQPHFFLIPFVGLIYILEERQDMKMKIKGQRQR